MKTASLIALVAVLSLLVSLLIRFRHEAEATVRRYFTTPAGPFNLAVARVLFYVAVLVSFPSLSRTQGYARLPADLIVPPGNGGVLLSHLPITTAAVSVAYAITLAGAVLGLVGLFPRFASAMFVLAGFYYFGVPQLYGKINHEHHLLWIGAIFAVSRSADALSLGALWRAWRRPSAQAVEAVRPSLHYSLPLRFIWLILGLLYFSAGVAKYRFDGLEWFAPHTLAHWLHLLWFQKGYRPPLVGRPDELSPLLVAGAAFTLVFETTFVLWIFSERARPFLAFAAVLFHNATNFLMHIAFWTLQLINLCLIDWERVSRAVFRRRAPVFFVYDGNCGACKRSVVGLGSLAPPGAIQFVNGLDRQALASRSLDWLEERDVVADVQIVAGERAFAGYDGYRRVARRVPVLWPLLPLLYLPPVGALGTRVYRRIADSHSYSLRQPETVPARRAPVSAMPSVAVGAPIVAVLALLSLAALRSSDASTRALNGWPFATYPSFAGVGNDTTTILSMRTRASDGATEAVSLQRRLPFMSSERFVGLVDSIVRRQNPGERQRALVALVGATRLRGNGGQAVDNLTIVSEQVSIAPKTAGRVLGSTTLLMMSSIPHAGRTTANATPPRRRRDSAAGAEMRLSSLAGAHPRSRAREIT